MTTETSSSSTAIRTAEPADRREFWRRLLAVLAPAPWVALALANAVTPETLGGSTEQAFADFAAHQTRGAVAVIMSALFVILLVPSGVALMMACRRVLPRATTLLGGFVTLAFCMALLNPGANLIALVVAREGLDASAGIRLVEELERFPLTAVVILPFFLTITLGRIALGVMLLRARIAPRWMAVALLLAAPVEFLGLFVAGNAGPALSYALTAIGFASVSVALLRTSDDAFDLPPLPRA